ncbi:MAG: molybdopterin-dependent oxidoreductase [Alphaproteobacteria bacterium]|jgi:DMSO/TMAO reductase YedYZ molybdopterin-dependent catalytic subunit|nr:molybdopterin-dependent oxidoreductase [Alphaproteobacteria bacterium]
MPVRKRPSPLGLNATPKEIIQAATAPLDDASRRVFAKQLLSLGGLSLLTGVTLSHTGTVTPLLQAMSRFNDHAQAKLFDPTKLAPTYTLNDLTEPFPFNAYYGIEDVPVVDGSTYALEVSGLVRDRRAWRLSDLRALPQESQITRHICVEGWSAIGQWGGVRFAHFLERIGADLTAKYVGFVCADDYYTSIDMPTALHPQTLLALTTGPTLQPLPPADGYPLKLRIPTKLGFKNPKHIMAITATNRYPGGYWEDQGYNWFSGS